jgi:hypothetical protein
MPSKMIAEREGMESEHNQQSTIVLKREHWYSNRTGPTQASSPCTKHNDYQHQIFEYMLLDDCHSYKVPVLVISHHIAYMAT